MDEISCEILVSDVIVVSQSGQLTNFCVAVDDTVLRQPDALVDAVQKICLLMLLAMQALMS
jgi:hypothetical protein